MDFLFFFFFILLFLLLLYRRPGILFWRVCSPPFHNALERQYSQKISVETFSQRKSNGREVSWTHDLFQMLQINRSTGQVKPLQRIRSSPPVPCTVWVGVFFFFHFSARLFLPAKLFNFNLRQKLCACSLIKKYASPLEQLSRSARELIQIYYLMLYQHVLQSKRKKLSRISE